MRLVRKFTAFLLAVMIVCTLLPTHAAAAMPGELIGDQYPTVRFYLEKFCDITGNAYCQPSKDGFVYVAGDSAWLSADEWKALTSDLDRTITREEIDLIETRYVEMQKNIYNFGRDKTYEGFMETVETFCPEFLSLLEDRKVAISYWLSTVELGIFSMGDLQDFLHEIQHEGGATRSGCFESRGKTPTSIYVNWSHRPSVFWYYDSLTREWVSVKSIGTVPYTAALMKNKVPDEVKYISIYKSYYMNDNAASNEWGIYGILTEFASTVVEARAAAICVSAGRSGYTIKKTTTMPYMTAARYYFWRANVLGYLAALREKVPQQYESLISNRQLVTLILHLIDFGEEQMQYENMEDIIEEKINGDSAYSQVAYKQVKTLLDWSNSYNEELEGLRVIYEDLVERDGYILCCENCVHPHE